MRPGRIVRALAVALAVVAIVGAVLMVGLRGGSTTVEPRAATPSTARPAPAPSHDVLALGDSVPSGAACGCRPFPQTYGALLSRRTGARVTVDNRAVAGLRTSGLIAQLRTPAYRAAVRRADIIVVTIGANDFGDHHDQVVNGQCGAGNTDCVSDEVTALQDHLTSLLATLRSLRNGAPTTILVTGYWNVFEDGDVARNAFGESGLRASLDLTRRVNAVISSVSAAGGARYVDIFRPFERHGRAITSLLAGDGDHPDARGHDLIARSLLDAGLIGAG